jgi:hypothetical protein
MRKEKDPDSLVSVVLKFYFASIISPLNTFMRKAKDPDPESDPEPDPDL